LISGSENPEQNPWQTILVHNSNKCQISSSYDSNLRLLPPGVLCHIVGRYLPKIRRNLLLPASGYTRHPFSGLTYNFYSVSFAYVSTLPSIMTFLLFCPLYYFISIVISFYFIPCDFLSPRLIVLLLISFCELTSWS
jgi:hypothetical protein